MAAARTSVRQSNGRGLSGDEVQAIRDGVGAGRRPRVMFTAAAGQIAGQVGQVVSLLDPAESDEWMVVRFGRDELPFSPSDLQVAPKGAAARKAAVPSPAREAVTLRRPEPEFLIDKPVPARSTATAAPPSAAAADGSAKAAPTPATASGNSASPSAAAGSGNAVPTGSGSEKAAAPPAPRKGASRPVKGKAPAGLTVTLAYAEGEWTVAAAQGSKTLARPYVIRPAEALRMVSLVDVPGVQEAVEQIMAVERAEAEQQAQRLRAELAEIEARLAELRDAG